MIARTGLGNGKIDPNNELQSISLKLLSAASQVQSSLSLMFTGIDAGYGADGYVVCSCILTAALRQVHHPESAALVIQALEYVQRKEQQESKFKPLVDVLHPKQSVRIVLHVIYLLFVPASFAHSALCDCVLSDVVILHPQDDDVQETALNLINGLIDGTEELRSYEICRVFLSSSLSY